MTTLLGWLAPIIASPIWNTVKAVLSSAITWAVLATLLGAGMFHQCSQKRTAKEALRVTAAHVSRLQADTLNLQRTITGATAITKTDYAKQQKQLTQDSIRVASLPESVLEHETDSLLRANRAYLAARAGNQ